MAETRNIVIIGGSNAGLGVAHGFLKHHYQSLKSSDTSVKYQVHVIDPSTHYWWRICAPRAVIATSEMPHDKTFLSIADGFKQYDADAFVLHQAKATSVDTTSRTVSYQSESGSSSTISYYALVIATGSNTPTPLTSLHGSHKKSIAALDVTNKRISTARSIVIGGGGPVGVEIAGEIGEKVNGASGYFAKSNVDGAKVKVTLVTSSDKLLPILSKGQSEKAEKLLARVGVNVIYNTKVEKADISAADAEIIAADGSFVNATGGDKSIVYLSNGKTLEADIYIPAVGATPNTAYLPKDLLNPKGYVKTTSDLRVEAAGPRVYVCGDAQDNTAGGIMSLQAAVPVVVANLASDVAKGGKAKQAVKEKEFTFKLGQTQMVPIGRSKGVASAFGYNLPSFACWAAKGRDYMLGNAKPIVSGAKW